MSEDKVVQDVDEETREKLSILDSIYVNKFFIGWGKEGIVRLTFADIVDETKVESTKYIVSLLMTPSGLMSLKLMLDNFVAMKQPTGQLYVEPPKDREPLN